MSNEKYFTHIKPKDKVFDFNIKELIEYRDLIGLFVKRNFKLIYAQTILGPLWLIITPFVTSVVFSFVFGGLAGISTDGVPSFLFYMAGNTLWGLFNSTLISSANSFLLNAPVFKKVYFPRLAAPISQSITSIANFLIQFFMLCIIWGIYFVQGENLSFNIYMLLIPVFILQIAILGTGVGLVVTSLTTKFKDLIYVVGFGVQLWMYITPIVYPLSSATGMMYYLLLINPVTPLINNFKYALLGTGEFLIASWIFSIIFTVIVFVFGIVLFNRTEKTFVDTI